MATFQEALRTRDFTLTAQLQLTKLANREAVQKQASILSPVVDAIQVTSNPGGLVQMSSLAAASILLQNGVDAIAHMNCRDRNNLALQSELLGARAIGIRNLLVQRGDALPEGYQPKTRQVYDMGSKALIRNAVELAKGSGPDELMVGAVVTLFSPKSTWRANSLVAKLDAGARFLQTQMCFDLELLRRYMKRLVDLRITHRAHVVVSLATLPTAETAYWIRDNVRGSTMPDAVIRRLAQAADPEQEGVRLCAELMQEALEIPGVGGVNLITPGDIHTIPAAIAQAAL